MLEHAQIKQVLPHRYPFLLVDRILALEPGKSAVGIKNVSGNEPFFAGHFPAEPIMPGVLIIEALAQVGGVAILAGSGQEGRLAFLAGIDAARFRRLVRPGDQLRLEVSITRLRGRAGRAKGTALVGDEVAAAAELLYMLGD
ncbi:MAG: 3-hydroxyacyl-ACP dehydratase FabZ [Bacillota bacterium]